MSWVSRVSGYTGNVMGHKSRVMGWAGNLAGK